MEKIKNLCILCGKPLFYWLFNTIIHYRKIISQCKSLILLIFLLRLKRDAQKCKKMLALCFDMCRMRIVATARIENLRASDSNEHLQIFSWDTASLKWLNFVLDDLTIFWLTYFDDLHRPNSSSFRSAWETSNIVMVLAVGK